MESTADFESEAKMLEAILHASASGAHELLDDLLFKQKGGEILGVCRDESGRTPLHLSAANGHQECVESLLVAGHAWNAVDDHYVSAGELAKQNGHDVIYELLLQAGIRTELLLALIEAQEADEEAGPEDEVCEFDSDGNPLKQAAISAATPVASNSSASNADYLEMSLQYSPGGTRLLDAEKNAVMMDWEAPLMSEHARILCDRPEKLVDGRSQLHILNVGFGLGLVDEAIQSHKPARHTIIEAHPDVHAKMLKDGWDQKPGVKILFGRWQDFLLSGELELYDGIFWDTFGEHYRDQRAFHEAVPLVLQPDGIFSFFNGLGGTNPFFHDVYCKIVEMEFAELGYSTEYRNIKMDTSDPALWEGVKRRYWSLNEYNLPIIRALPAEAFTATYESYDLDEDEEEAAIQDAIKQFKAIEELENQQQTHSESSAPM